MIISKVLNLINSIERGIRKSFSSVKLELDNHLDSINQNTDELQNLNSHLNSLESKMNKLSDMIDELYFSINPSLDVDKKISDLSIREQEIFLAIYTNESPLSAKFIANRLGFTVEMVGRYVSSLIMKGIPILRQFDKSGDSPFFSLELKFKDLHARKNIVVISDVVSRQLLSEQVI